MQDHKRETRNVYKQEIKERERVKNRVCVHVYMQTMLKNTSRESNL
jgi:hypothetical protein